MDPNLDQPCFDDDRDHPGHPEGDRFKEFFRLGDAVSYWEGIEAPSLSDGSAEGRTSE